MNGDIGFESVRRNDGEPLPECRLWMAVIKAAWTDLFEGGGDNSQSARQFLTGGGQSGAWRDLVCEMAGICTGGSLLLAAQTRMDREAAEAEESKIRAGELGMLPSPVLEGGTP